MAIKTVQIKGVSKIMQNDTEKKDKQINDVYLKTNGRLFTCPECEIKIDEVYCENCGELIKVKTFHLSEESF